MSDLILTDDNYYSMEADKEYMSVSVFKDFFGTYGRIGCEFRAKERLDGKWTEKPTTAMLVGSYVDSYFEDTLERFKGENPSLFKKDGGLKAEYVRAEKIIARIERDPYFMRYMSGEKQVIMTGELFGSKWKVKMDSYLPGVAIVDLKVMASITELKWVKDLGYLDVVRYWGYDIQGAVYQEIVRQNTGERLPFYIAAATKENEPDIRIIQVTQNYLDEALHVVEANLPKDIEDQVRGGPARPLRIMRLLQAHEGADKADLYHGSDSGDIAARSVVEIWQITENIITSN